MGSEALWKTGYQDQLSVEAESKISSIRSSRHSIFEKLVNKIASVE